MSPGHFDKTKSVDDDDITNNQASTTSSASSAPAPTPEADLDGSDGRLWAGALTTAFEAAPSCRDRWGVYIPTTTVGPNLPEITAVRDGGRCISNNPCLPWHDRKNEGFFSPAYDCPVGWRPQMTMQDGSYIMDGTVATAEATPTLFPINTMKPSETAIVCCPYGFSLDASAAAATAACTAVSDTRPLKSLPTVTCDKPGPFGAAFPSGNLANSPWASALFANTPVRKVAVFVEIHWQSSDITSGGPTPTAYTLRPVPTSGQSDVPPEPEPGSNDRIIKIAASMATLFVLLILAFCGGFLIMRRLRRRKREQLKSESNVRLHPAAVEMDRSPTREMTAVSPSSGAGSGIGAGFGAGIGAGIAAAAFLSPLPMAHIAESTPSVSSASISASASIGGGDNGDPFDPPPPYATHDRTDFAGAPPQYQTPQYQTPHPDGVEWMHHASASRPLSMLSEATHDHALITDGWR